jgi:hypothetical protein
MEVNDDEAENLNDYSAGASSTNRIREKNPISSEKTPLNTRVVFIKPEEYFQNFIEILGKCILILHCM